VLWTFSALYFSSYSLTGETYTTIQLKFEVNGSVREFYLKVCSFSFANHYQPVCKI